MASSYRATKVLPRGLVYITTGMLLLAVLEMPYGYYTLLRIVATGTFAFAAVVAYGRSYAYLPWIYGLLAALFNPVILVSLPKETWQAVDIAAASFLVATAHLYLAALRYDEKTR